ncbi:hypothetical protein Cgig2_030043 [Carnegiea gigantea]|uniref:DUF4283 domain-containing protein n=1 Tax=Carnegiea gigantea TaxID=171969 RepID=A0A9Q1K2L3_9CARY|nr:hypothetical protein Cgig2_030043 [Carnegiea gigantea]
MAGGRRGRSQQTAATAPNTLGSSNGRGTGSPIPILDQESKLENNGEEWSKTVNAYQILDEKRENEPDKRTTTYASLILQLGRSIKGAEVRMAWNEDLSMDISALHTLPLWVQFPELDIKYWGLDSLSKLGSMLGKPIKTEKTTKDKSTLSYARLLIEMPISGPFPDYIDFVNYGDRAMKSSTLGRNLRVKRNGGSKFLPQVHRVVKNKQSTGKQSSRIPSLVGQKSTDFPGKTTQQYTHPQQH